MYKLVFHVLLAFLFECHFFFVPLVILPFSLFVFLLLPLLPPHAVSLSSCQILSSSQKKVPVPLSLNAKDFRPMVEWLCDYLEAHGVWVKNEPSSLFFFFLSSLKLLPFLKGGGLASSLCFGVGLGRSVWINCSASRALFHQSSFSTREYSRCCLCSQAPSQKRRTSAASQFLCS